MWCTTVATQTMAEDTHWLVMVGVAMAVALACGLINGVLVAYGPIVPFIATLAMLASARGLAEIIANRRTQIVKVDGFNDFLRGDFLGISVLIWIFALVSVVGWVLLNRTTFGRRTIAVGGNPEAARLAGINVKWHTVMLYVLVGFCCGIAALMITARTTTGSSTHGVLWELDAIAAVVIGGTLLTGGRGTIVGTVFGVLIFQTLTSVFVQNNLSSSAQNVAKGVIIVLAVLLQQRLAGSTTDQQDQQAQHHRTTHNRRLDVLGRHNPRRSHVRTSTPAPSLPGRCCRRGRHVPGAHGLHEQRPGGVRRLR